MEKVKEHFERHDRKHLHFCASVTYLPFSILVLSGKDSYANVYWHVWPFDLAVSPLRIYPIKCKSEFAQAANKRLPITSNYIFYSCSLFILIPNFASTEPLKCQITDNLLLWNSGVCAAYIFFICLWLQSGITERSREESMMQMSNILK